MKIEITDAKENKIVSLLTEIIKMSQIENEQLTNKTGELKQSKQLIEGEISVFLNEIKELLGDEIVSLNDAQEKIKSEVSTIRTRNIELSNDVSAFLEGIKNLFEGTVTSLPETKEKLKSMFSEITEKNKELSQETTAFLYEINNLFEGGISSLGDARVIIKAKVSTLEDNVTQLADTIKKLEHKALFDRLNTFVIFFESNIDCIQDEKWKQFVSKIVSGISDALESSENAVDTLYKIQGKNGWLTKTASLFWWGKESHVERFIPSCLGRNSMFDKMFTDFITYLESQKICINIPQGDFSNELGNYKADYDEKSSLVKDLFPQYHPEEFVLCEISFLSINSNPGKCIGW